MAIDDNDLSRMIEALKLETSIEETSIPSIDLYMDQVITFFESKLAYTKRSREDKLLTKTMINNYTKDKLLMPAVKKKYTKEHIILMILLYELKHVLTIGDIKELFGTLIHEDVADAEKLSAVYQVYLNCKVKATERFEESADEILEVLKEEIQKVNLSDGEQIQNMLLTIMLTQKAVYYKRLAEKIIDEKIKTSK